MPSSNWALLNRAGSSATALGFCVALAVVGLGFSAQAARKGDVAAGKETAQVCLACHGETGVSETEGIPSLAGQTDNFLQWQLVFFRSGQRKNELMSPQAANLSDEDIRNLGAYFNSLTPPPKVTDDSNPELSKAGQAVAEQHHCSSCHLDSFEGKQAAARLVNQREDYLAKALSDYRSAARPSTGVAAMTEAASGLSDDDIKALAHFLATYH